MSPPSSEHLCEHILSSDGYCVKCGAIANGQVILLYIIYTYYI